MNRKQYADERRLARLIAGFERDTGRMVGSLYRSVSGSTWRSLGPIRDPLSLRCGFGRSRMSLDFSRPRLPA